MARWIPHQVRLRLDDRAPRWTRGVLRTSQWPSSAGATNSADGSKRGLHRVQHGLNLLLPIASEKLGGGTAGSRRELELLVS